MNSCKFADCKNKVKAKGYCETHYQRVRRHGDVSIVKKSGRTLLPNCPYCKTKRT